ncbi:GspE/PulE family protein [Chloroflexota bacterium]
MSASKDNRGKSVHNIEQTSDQQLAVTEEEQVQDSAEALMEQEAITPQESVMLAAFGLDVPYVDLTMYQIQPEALRLVTESMARRYHVIPLAVVDNALHVAMADVDDARIIEALVARTRMRVEPAAALPGEIWEAIDRSYKAYDEIEEQFETPPPPPVEEQVSIEAIAGAPAVRALNLLVDEAIKNRASDIHLEPQEDRLRVRYRIDGVLQETMSLPLSALAPLISRIKILAGMNIADHRPQDGQFSIKIRDRQVDVRVATVHTAYGEMGNLRILDKSFAALSLAEIGFLTSNLERYKKMLCSPFGMILISGPTGSGKTTTLYASIGHLDCKGRNIITVEDPVEYTFKDINQIQVNPRSGLTFATGLRAIMRHDPDVILVGEIRDSETTEIAIQSALTGHMVLSSIHANDTVGVLFRLLDLGVEPFLISSSLVGVVTQRLVRRICPHCRHTTRAPVQGQIAYEKELGEERTEFIYGRGCNACANTGYLGRTAIFEILPMSEEIKRMLLTQASASQIRVQAQEEGMESMWRDGMIKVKAGITTPCEVVRSVPFVG